MVMNSFSYCMSENVFILSLFLKDVFTGYRIPAWQFLSFSALKMLLHLFICIVSDEKIWFGLYLSYSVTCLFFLLAAFKIFFFSLLLSNVIIVCHDEFFFVFLVLGVCWASCICGFVIFIKFENFGSLFLQIFFHLSSLGISVTLMLGHLKLSHSHLCAFPFFGLFFLCVFLMGSFYCCAFKFIYLFFCNISLLLIPSSLLSLYML